MTTPHAVLVRCVGPVGKDETAEDDFSVDVSATGSQFQEHTTDCPDEGTPGCGETVDGRRHLHRPRVASEESSESRFCNIYKVSQHGRSAAITQFRQHLALEDRHGRSLGADYCVTARECKTATQTY